MLRALRRCLDRSTAAVGTSTVGRAPRADADLAFAHNEGRTRDQSRLAVALVTMAGALLLAPAAQGLDYDRNDVLGRELGFFAGSLPIDGRPLGLAVRGVARRHTRFLTLGTEVLIGATSAPRPLIGVMALLGAETSDNAWDRLRGYGEFGFGLMWANNELFDLLSFHVEGGTRILIQDAARPHLSLTLGMRLSTDFSGVGFAFLTGMSWAFD